VFVQLHPAQANGQVNIDDNTITATGTFGAATAVHGVQLRGNGPVSLTGNVIDGGNVGGSGTTPASSAVFIQSRSGSTIMPATTVITGSCNRFRNFHHGVSVFDSFNLVYGNLDPAATVSFENNAIENNDTAQVANGATPTLDFENNWWGCAGTCDTVTGAVDTDPELIAPPACVECTVDAECNDGDICNGVETCNLGTNQCEAGTDPCGDGSTQGVCGEVCDDGNTNSGDGCSATCQPEFDVCTPAPLVGCRAAAPTKSQLAIKNKTPDTKDQTQWKWSKGAITPKADFGDPTATTTYQLCIYADGALFSEASVPAGGMCGTKFCWKANAKGFQYKNKLGTPEGVTQLALKEGLVAGKAQIQVKGKGDNLDLPAVLSITQPVVVQLKNSNNVCWETIHCAPASKNDGVQFKDKND
jgi:cysteine-rich repeat protein